MVTIPPGDTISREEDAHPHKTTKSNKIIDLKFNFISSNPLGADPAVARINAKTALDNPLTVVVARIIHFNRGLLG